MTEMTYLESCLLFRKSGKLGSIAKVPVTHVTLTLFLILSVIAVRWKECLSQSTLTGFGEDNEIITFLRRKKCTMSMHYQVNYLTS